MGTSSCSQAGKQADRQAGRGAERQVCMLAAGAGGDIQPTRARLSAQILYQAHSHTNTLARSLVANFMPTHLFQLQAHACHAPTQAHACHMLPRRHLLDYTLGADKACMGAHTALQSGLGHTLGRTARKARALQGAPQERTSWAPGRAPQVCDAEVAQQAPLVVHHGHARQAPATGTHARGGGGRQLDTQARCVRRGGSRSPQHTCVQPQHACARKVQRLCGH